MGYLFSSPSSSIFTDIAAETNKNPELKTFVEKGAFIGVFCYVDKAAMMQG